MKKLISICITTLLLSSCPGDFLDLTPQHTSSESTFLKTKERSAQAINGAYQRLRGVRGVHGTLISEMRADNTHYIHFEADRAQRQYEEAADFTNDEQNIVIDDMYYNCFSGISRVNSILDRIEGMEFSEEFKNHTIGQAKFSRGYYYFQLVQYFGGIPLYLHEVIGVNDAFLARSSEEEVYKIVLSDVNDAAARLPVVSFPQNGFATQDSARMLLAYVLTTMPSRDYVGAEAQLREILKMGYELQTNYASVFEPPNKNSKESIFEVQFQQGDQGQESNWLYYFIPRTSEAEIITGVPASNTLSDAGWNVPTQEMVDSYEEGDLRIDPSVSIIAGHNGEYRRFVYDKVFNVGDLGIKDYPVSYYFISKYHHAHSKVENTDDNWSVYRYSDVLFLLAECLVEQGKTGEAVTFVNQIRQRVGLKVLSTVNADIVVKERRHELTFEGHRWQDLLHTGKVIEIMSEYGERMKSLYPCLTERTYQAIREKPVFPIPYRELRINSLLEQNTGC